MPLPLLLVTALLAAPQSPRFPTHPNQDVREYSIALKVDPAQKRLEATVDYTIAAVQPLTAVQLDAAHGPQWSVAFADADGKPLAATWHDDRVTVPLPAPVAAGASVRLRATLAGTPLDGFYFQPNRYGEPMAFTDHYSIRARGWLPCADNPEDRARFTLRIVHRQEHACVAFGRMRASAVAADGTVTTDCESAQEIPPYMLAIVVGPLARVPEAGDPRLVDHFVYRQDVDKAKQALVHDAAWIATMERTFGPYAYEKYTTVQCPTRWGGFEAPGNVQLMEGLFDGADHGTSTLAHELVHMWFGDAVGYAAWHEVWLSEGFASYFGPWLCATTGGPPLAESMARLRENWRKSREGRTRTIRDDTFPHPDQALNANTYPKGAWVLHMLRGELGDERFFAALREYYTSWRGRSVRTADLLAIVDQHATERMGWFFAQWLDRVGCPELRVAPGDGGIVVEQVQPGEPYVAWLRLRWQDEHGKSQQQRVRLTQPRQVVAVAGAVRSLEVDPDVELLFRPAR